MREDEIRAWAQGRVTFADEVLQPGSIIYWTSGPNPTAVYPIDVGCDFGVTVRPCVDDYADAVNHMWRNMLEAVSPQPQLDPGVQRSDMTGIQAARAHLILELKTEPAPVAPSRVKPALAGLGVTASGDHRLGRFNVAED